MSNRISPFPVRFFVAVISISTIVSLGASVQAQGNVTFESRIEMDLKDDFGGEAIYVMGDHGFVQAAYAMEKEDGDRIWKFDLYDTDLQKVKSATIALENKRWRDETFQDDDHLYFMFRDRRGNYSLVTVEIPSLRITRQDGYLSFKTVLSDMAAMGDYTWFTARTKKFPMLCSINWKTGAFKQSPLTIPGTKPKRIEMMGFQTLKKTSEVFSYLKVRRVKGLKDIFVLQMDKTGQITDHYNFSKGLDKYIVSVTTSPGLDGQYIFTGTYSGHSQGRSEGLFFAKGKAGKLNFIHFYNFLDLENFLNYLPERRIEKIERIAARKEAKGKEMTLSYLITGHEVTSLKDGYLYLGEAYYPTYRTERRQVTKVVNGVTTFTTENVTVFDGYQYTHAILARFDLEGNLVWDNIFELWPAYKPFHARRFIALPEKPTDGISLVFASRGKIYSKSFDLDGNLVKDEVSEPIETEYEGDKTKRSWSYLDYWFGKYFLAYGFQKIKNKTDEEVKNKRKVLFMNKIGF